jgi:hypothetical protein
METMEQVKIPLHGKHGKGKHVVVDGDYDGEYFGQYKWYMLPNGYAARDGRYEGKSSYIYLHNMVMPKREGYWVDHINRDRLDNRSCNLRYVTPKESALNRSYKDGRITINLDMSDEEVSVIIGKRREAKAAYIRSPKQKALKKAYDRERYLNRKHRV